MSPMPQAAGFGSEIGGVRKPYFWVHGARPPPVSGAHLSFAAPDRDTVDAFHAAALAAGGTDNGAPGAAADLPPRLLRRLRARPRRQQRRGRLPPTAGPPQATGRPVTQYDARRVRAALVIALVVAAAFGLAACGFGEEGIEVSKDDPEPRRAPCSSPTHCAGCHTLERRRHPGQRQPRRAGPGAEPQPAQRDLRRRALRDPERRLLRRDHAAEHRRRRRGRSRSPTSSPSTPAAKRANRRGPARIARPERGAVLDLKLIRSEPERVKAALARRGAAERVDELLALDARRRELLPESRSARAERNARSRSRSARPSRPARTPTEAIAAVQAS